MEQSKTEVNKIKDRIVYTMTTNLKVLKFTIREVNKLTAVIREF